MEVYGHLRGTHCAEMALKVSFEANYPARV